MLSGPFFSSLFLQLPTSITVWGTWIIITHVKLNYDIWPLLWFMGLLGHKWATEICTADARLTYTCHQTNTDYLFAGKHVALEHTSVLGAYWPWWLHTMTYSSLKCIWDVLHVLQFAELLKNACSFEQYHQFSCSYDGSKTVRYDYHEYGPVHNFTL